MPVLAGEISVVDGYLNFPTDEIFKEYITGLNESSSMQTKSTQLQSLKSVQGFKSISDLKNDIDTGTKSATTSDDEEMTLDEYRVMMAENLLLDPLLTEVMDTTLRIGVAGRIYKVTEHGTFSAPSNKAASLTKAIEKFDVSIVRTTQLGDYVNLADDVVFTNSFGDATVENQLVANMLEEPTEEFEEVENSLTTKALISGTFQNNLHNGYNVSTYNWKNNSAWQRFWDWVRGKDVSKEVGFDSKNRVQVNVYNVNYAFYATSGIKVKMQKKKKFLFVSYWVGTNADKMAIGFNKLYGEMKYTNPQSFSRIAPTASASWASFTGVLNGITSKFIYSEYKKLDVVKDWVDDIYIFTTCRKSRKYISK